MLVALSVLLADVSLVTFDGAAASTHKVETVDDPVMGGGSQSNITRRGDEGVWAGEVKIVKSLGAPGFCTMRTNDLKAFPDASGTENITMVLGKQWGLPLSRFTFQIGVHGLTAGQGQYDAPLHCTTKSLVGTTRCTATWSAFKLSYHGRPIPGPPIDDKLDKLSRVGVGVDGEAGVFELDIRSIEATGDRH